MLIADNYNQTILWRKGNIINKNNWEEDRLIKLIFDAAFSNEANQLVRLIQKGVAVDIQDEYGITPLMVAAENGNIESVLALIENGAKVNLSDQEGETALIHACQKKQRRAIINKLIAQGADIDKKDGLGRTALIIASSQCAENVCALLQFDPSLDVVTSGNETALSFAIVWEEKKIVELLINAGVDTTWKDNANWTYLCYAEETENSEIIDLLRTV